MLLLRVFTWLTCALSSTALVISGQEFSIKQSKRTDDGLTNLVTWDAHSVFVRGERLMIYGGEFHPYR